MTKMAGEIGQKDKYKWRRSDRQQKVMRGVGRSWEGKTGCGKMLYTGSVTRFIKQQLLSTQPYSVCPYMHLCMFTWLHRMWEFMCRTWKGEWNKVMIPISPPFTEEINEASRTQTRQWVWLKHTSAFSPLKKRLLPQRHMTHVLT